jgi:NAD(P)-dependent dehydrogenase (short-subunit alcohol dehydrogenase family)
MLGGKTIIITGAASGIGLAAARVFSDYGAAVAMIDVARERLEAAAHGIPKALPVVCDVADPDRVTTMVATTCSHFGTLDGAFNNAGIEGADGRFYPLANYPDEEFDRVLDINVRGLWNCLRAEIPALIAGGGGAIVNTASVMGWRGAPGMGAYVASKHAVAGLTRTAALDYARQGIRVNAVLPGAIETPMLTERGFIANPGFAAAAPSMHPMGRIGRAEEVAEAAAWLLSDRASFITGHLLAVDGGLSAG